MQPFRTIALGMLIAMLPIAHSPASARSDEPDDVRKTHRQHRIDRLFAEDAALREARQQLPACSDLCLTPIEAVARAVAAGPGQASKGLFILDVKGGGVDDASALDGLYYLNSHRNFRRLGTLTLAFEPDAMKQLLNPVPKATPHDDPGDAQIVVRAQRPRKRVLLTVANMMKRFSGRRILVDGEVKLKWISFVGTRMREGKTDEGYYQVWIRISSPDQVTILDQDASTRP
jgi:hypothetical protein